MKKRYFYISLTFNIVVLLTFVFFTFINPALKKTTKDQQKLQLTAVQQYRIDSLKQEFSGRERELREQNIRNRLYLWELMMEPVLDTLKISAVIEELETGENVLKDIRYDYYLKELFVLDPEQRIQRIRPGYLKLKTYLQHLEEETEEK